MSRRQTKQIMQPTHFCDDCIHAVPFDEWWNIGADGKPITLHCHRDKENIIKGIFFGTGACLNYKKK